MPDFLRVIAFGQSFETCECTGEELFDILNPWQNRCIYKSLAEMPSLDQKLDYLSYEEIVF